MQITAECCELQSLLEWNIVIDSNNRSENSGSNKVGLTFRAHTELTAILTLTSRCPSTAAPQGGVMEAHEQERSWLYTCTTRTCSLSLPTVQRVTIYIYTHIHECLLEAWEQRH